MGMQSHRMLKDAQAGDRAAFNQLVDHWYPRIYNFAYKYFGDHDLASEASQKTFLSVYQNLHQLRDLGRFRSWIYQIIHNFCHDESRRQQKKWTVSLFPRSDPDKPDENPLLTKIADTENAIPDQQMMQQDRVRLIQKALGQLKEEQRIIVILKVYEGFKFKEIAETLKISENTAKSRLYYGLKALRKILESWNINQENIDYEL